MTTTHTDQLMVFNSHPYGHDVIVAPDDRHAPLIKAGDLIVVDRAAVLPRVGGFFAVVYQHRGEDGVVHPAVNVQQCRRAALCEDECFVLGASSPRARRSESVDGFYDAALFARSVQGRVVGLLKVPASDGAIA